MSDVPPHDDSTPEVHATPVSINSPQYAVKAKRPARTEAVTAVAFLVSLVAFAAFGGAYWQDASNYWLGGTLGLGLFAFGFAFVCWGKYLMPQGPFTEPRALMQVKPIERKELIADFSSRGRVAIHRRGFLVAIMGAAGAVFSVVALFPLVRSLGPLPGRKLASTTWRRGSYLTTVDGKRVHVDDVNIGGVLTVFPEDDLGGAFSQTMLIHVDVQDITTKPGRSTWGPQGFLAYSKVCTHAGCPVGLYEQLTKQLLCPCHQSLFDVLIGAEPIFGPAPRPLAQLPLYIDKSGYLRAQSGYDEPIGPGYWERGGTT
jgi:ubiquinol-cytochrome c reductase iron-sulfur subunit